jgi:histidinol phosphatase-like enzyme
MLTGMPRFDIANHPWRKQNPGMIIAAGEQMKLDLAHSWIVALIASARLRQ